MNPKRLFLITAASCGLVACDRAPAPQVQAPFGPDVLAQVGEQPISLSDFQAELEHRARGRPEVWASFAKRESLLQEMINRESVYLRAKAAGFDQKPEIARQLKTLIIDRYLADQLRPESELPAVSEAEVAEFYQEHPGQFALPEQVRFAVIKFGFSPKATAEKKAETLRQAELVWSAARAAKDSPQVFALLAQRHSDDQATRYLGGDSGWVARGERAGWNEAVVTAAFALAAPGDLAPVIKTSDAYHVVKLIARNAGGQRPFSEVAEALRYQLAVAKRHRLQQQTQATINAGFKIEINRPLLESLPVPSAPNETPPSVPAGG